MFINIEGGNASGKTTIINKLVDALQRRGKKVIYLKSPTLPFDKMWTSINDCDTLTKYYFFRAVAQNDSKKIEELLKVYDFVILERYLYETEAFDLTLEKLNSENKIKKHINYGDLLKPDITFFLTVSEHERQKRIDTRNNDKSICYWERPEFQKEYNKFYEAIAKENDFIMVDTQLNSVDECIKIICEKIFAY
jgi:thymidylate kinase